ncbi:hypothetical protein BH09BAC2_BH09BAC2_17130 [soil metagenome]
MKQILFIAAAFITFSLAGCKNSNDPKSAIQEFFDAMGKKDIPKAKTFATKDSEGMIGMMETGMSKDSSMMSQFDKSNISFGDAKINGDKATVPVINKKASDTTNFILKKEDGKWKVAFDMNSIMEMMQEKMKAAGARMQQEGNIDGMQQNMNDSMPHDNLHDTLR